MNWSLVLAIAIIRLLLLLSLVWTLGDTICTVNQMRISCKFSSPPLPPCLQERWPTITSHFPPNCHLQETILIATGTSSCLQHNVFMLSLDIVHNGCVISIISLFVSCLLHRKPLKMCRERVLGYMQHKTTTSNGEILSHITSLMISVWTMCLLWNFLKS